MSNVFDLIFGTGLVVGFLIGYKTGFIRQFFTLFFVCVLLYVAAFFYEPIGNSLQNALPFLEPQIVGAKPFWMFLVIFMVPYIIIMYLNLQSFNRSGDEGRSLIGRTLGGLCGALSVAIGAGLIIAVLTAEGGTLGSADLSTSVTYPLYERIISIILAFLPPHLKPLAV